MAAGIKRILIIFIGAMSSPSAIFAERTLPPLPPHSAEKCRAFVKEVAFDPETTELGPEQSEQMVSALMEELKNPKQSLRAAEAWRHYVSRNYNSVALSRRLPEAWQTVSHLRDSTPNEDDRLAYAAALGQLTATTEEIFESKLKSLEQTFEEFPLTATARKIWANRILHPNSVVGSAETRAVLRVLHSDEFDYTVSEDDDAEFGNLGVLKKPTLPTSSQKIVREYATAVLQFQNFLAIHGTALEGNSADEFLHAYHQALVIPE